MRFVVAVLAFGFPFFASSFGAAPASTARADAPRIAVVVEGDPAEATRGAAERLESALAATNEAALPTDALVRAALRGAEGTADDGLDPVRGLRRRLGWSTEADHDALAAIGERLELVAIVLVHGGASPAARVYDVSASHFFVGEAALDDASLETSARFVLARVRAAERRRASPPVAGATETGPAAATAAETAAAASAAPASASVSPDATLATPAADQPVQRSWIRRNWPFLVAGGLLVGATTFFIVQRAGNDTTPPVIHVRPGGS